MGKFGKGESIGYASCEMTLINFAFSLQPDHLASAKLSDYFDLTFAALPHKILLPEKFEEAVIDLRKRLTDREREDFVFKPAYHKRIPADGVPFYMEGIWVSCRQSMPSPALLTSLCDLAKSLDQQGPGSTNPARAFGTVPLR
jgi:hypothetical protein